MTPAHRIEAVLTEDGKLSLDRLPFHTGQTVEVTVVLVPTENSLIGTVVRYDRPTEPVAEADWGVLR